MILLDKEYLISEQHEIRNSNQNATSVASDQRISTMDALRAVTIDAAWQVFQEGNRGSLEPGKFADLVVLSGNPLEQPMDLRELVVEQTLIGGATVYRKP